MTQIKLTREWQKIHQNICLKYNANGTENDAAALIVFLREQHAKQAEFLPFTEWPSPNGHRTLIENGEIRQKLGQFIGQLAASHWWNHDVLAANLNRKIPAPASFPAV
ncbi:hypothetical protein B5P45_02115 [Phyllobacterium zundukense]|uniref:HD-CE domain-containing protein n=1 Tax=Phyllobacterium zundukense TaxID=1867719 RepID=A0A2N9W4F0_9HYPH|nr:hypothetical protein [Phyllobacterium zundukense]ATU91913.1 hypothetical protein BLM14_09965 [Phyllobacterium zundukense]PIO46618.1 hypothetical protein B5P45_02115 [Phyllobacterium zundukense]